MDSITITGLYDLEKTIMKEYLKDFTYPFEALAGIGDEIVRLGKSLGDGYKRVGEDIFISKTAKIADTALIQGPCIIDEGAEIRHCAFIRGKAVIGKGSVVGNSCEIKNSIIFDLVQVPHFNYVGDSILGYRVHLGAGAITSNIKSDRTKIVIRTSTDSISTNLIKVGAFLGDFVEVGCNSVLNPGTVVGRKSNIYPLSMVRGVVGENKIYKKKGEIVEKYERDEN